MKKVLAPILSVLLCLAVGVVPAADAEPLTRAKVQSFVKSMEDVHELSKKYEQSLVDVNHGSDGDADDAFGKALEGIKAHPAYREFVTVIQGHGFADPEQWSTTGTRVMLAFAALLSEGQQPEIDKQLAQAMAQIDQSGMSADQKAAMRKMMEATGQTLATMQDSVTEADKQAVRPSIEAIKAWEKLD